MEGGFVREKHVLPYRNAHFADDPIQSAACISPGEDILIHEQSPTKGELKTGGE